MKLSALRKVSLVLCLLGMTYLVAVYLFHPMAIYCLHFVLLSAIAVGLLLTGPFREWRRDQRAQQGLCRDCGYDLTGNVSGKCPECGRPL